MSTTGRSTATLPAITCIGSPAMVVNVVRRHSWRRAISVRLRASAATWTPPARRMAVRIVYTLVPGRSASSTSSVMAQNSSGSTPDSDAASITLRRSPAVAIPGSWRRRAASTSRTVLALGTCSTLSRSGRLVSSSWRILIWCEVVAAPVSARRQRCRSDAICAQHYVVAKARQLVVMATTLRLNGNVAHLRKLAWQCEENAGDTTSSRSFATARRTRARNLAIGSLLGAWWSATPVCNASSSGRLRTSPRKILPSGFNSAAAPFSTRTR